LELEAETRPCGVAEKTGVRPGPEAGPGGHGIGHGQGWTRVGRQLSGGHTGAGMKSWTFGAVTVDFLWTNEKAAYVIDVSCSSFVASPRGFEPLLSA